MQKIILEGFWGVGKSTFINNLKDDFEKILEPYHQNELDLESEESIDTWYINKNLERFEKFTQSNINVILERSVLSSIAYQYAQGKDISIYKDNLKQIQKLREHSEFLIVLFYTDYELLPKNIKNTYSKDFFLLYHKFYREILPLEFGLVVNFIQTKDQYRYLESKEIQQKIQAIIYNDRICQANVVCYKIINNEPKFLVLKRNPKKGSFWQTITGGVHMRGLLLENALRELQEELSLEVITQNSIKTNCVFWYIGGEGYELSEYVFGYKLDDKDKIILSDEHTEFEFLPLKEAVERVKYDGNKQAIQSVYNEINS